MCPHLKTFSTSYTCQLWRNFKFLRICHVEKFEITQHGEKFQISPHLSCIQIWNFSTWQIFLHISNLWYLWQISGMSIGFRNCSNCVIIPLHHSVLTKSTKKPILKLFYWERVYDHQSDRDHMPQFQQERNSDIA